MSGGVLAIINGRAGGAGTGNAPLEITRLVQDAVPQAEVFFTDEHTDVAARAREAVAGGARLVIAGGGDGTINAVASALVGTGARLGLLPLGTLNHFARDLLIPMDVEGALRTIAAGHETAVDVGEVNQKVFLNNSGLGLYPGIVALREQRQRAGMSKWPALAGATIRVLSRYRLLTVRVELAGKALVRTTPVVFVGNNEYLTEGLRVGTRDRLDRGTLSLFIPNQGGPFRLLWFSLRAVLGLKERPGDLDHLLAKELHIESGHRLVAVSIDGEVTHLRVPLHYRIRPLALRVIVPAPKA